MRILYLTTIIHFIHHIVLDVPASSLPAHEVLQGPRVPVPAADCLN